MPKWEVTAYADGTATVTVEAENEEEAQAIAYAEHLTGINIGCGVANWEIESIIEQDS